LWNGALLAAPFDLDRLEISGPAAILIEGVLADPVYGGGHLAFSSNGTLVYLPPAGDLPWVLEWVDRRKEPQALLKLDRGRLSYPAISPNGRRTALRIQSSTQDVWVYDMERGSLTRLTFGGHASSIAWTPDGERVTFGYKEGDRPFNLYWKVADERGEPEPLVSSEFNLFPKSWAPEGKVLAYELEKELAGRPVACVSIQPIGSLRGLCRGLSLERTGVADQRGWGTGASVGA
jgi:Tol biopolymer transport system component